VVGLTLEEVLMGLIPVIVGFALGVPISTVIRDQLRKRKIALILNSEIHTIRKITEQMIGDRKKDLEKWREQQKNPTTMVNPCVDDTDFPTNMFISFREEIGLFNANLITILSDLYNWISYAQHWRDVSLRHSADFESFLISAKFRPSGPIAADIQSIKDAGGLSIHYAEAYIKCLDTIQRLSDEAIFELNRIKRYNPVRSPIVGFDKPVVTEFPPSILLFSKNNGVSLKNHDRPK